jgi:6-phosphogluconate dehydrogenase
MVHNGIEYGDMQLIGEVYDILKVRTGIVAAVVEIHLRRIEFLMDFSPP